jgi:Pyruvate/2-oxoacid:ferredoxin oxidoreductase gamma subunit
MGRAVEHQLLMTGIGGQGIQLASQVLATAAVLAGHDVQLFGSYEGMMRGGATEATLIVAEEEVQAPPTIHQASAAIVMHHEHAEGVIARVGPGGLLLVNSSVVENPVVGPACTVLALPATDMAVEVGHAMTASIVMAGAFAGVTGLVGLALLEEAVAQCLPPYRRAHVPLNVAALSAGLERARDNGSVSDSHATRTAPAP